jgi:predicted nucleotidyltransferase
MAKIFIDSNAFAAVASLLLRLGATEVFVFGSATKADLRPGSDIDLAVRGLPPSVLLRGNQQGCGPPRQTS